MHQQAYIELSSQEVVRRASRLWKAAGSPGGRTLEFWLQAEVELLEAIAASLRKTQISGLPPPIHQ
jgi:hypothetical protein